MNPKKRAYMWAVAILQMSVIIIFFLCSCDRYERLDLSPPEMKQYPTEITLEEAEKMLLEMMSEFDSSPTKSGGSLSRKISGGYSVGEPINVTKDGEVLPYFHIFNFEDESGFAIMSGDTRVTPLLAYALEGNINQGDTIDNPGLAIYLSRLNTYFNNVIGADTAFIYDGNIGDEADNYVIDFHVTDMEAGYCPVKWHQSYPYNYYCEEYSKGKTLTGCVATAVAQLMAIYRHPDKYSEFSLRDEYDINNEEYHFDWEQMIEKSNELREKDDDEVIIGGPSPIDGIVDVGDGLIPPDPEPLPVPDSSILQIARLMQLIGTEQNLDNIISPDSSSTGAHMSNIPRTLRNFGYSSGGEQIFYFEDRNTVRREQDVIDELENGHYVIMAGQESYKIASNIIQFSEEEERAEHCWLVHGLMTKTTTFYEVQPPYIATCYYYLCNYGWGGAADGYYLSDVFDTVDGPDYPDVKGPVDEGNYSDKDYMTYIIGIRK